MDFRHWEPVYHTSYAFPSDPEDASFSPIGMRRTLSAATSYSSDSANTHSSGLPSLDGLTSTSSVSVLEEAATPLSPQTSYLSSIPYETVQEECDLLLAIGAQHCQSRYMELSPVPSSSPEFEDTTFPQSPQNSYPSRYHALPWASNDPSMFNHTMPADQRTWIDVLADEATVSAQAQFAAQDSGTSRMRFSIIKSAEVDQVLRRLQRQMQTYSDPDRKAVQEVLGRYLANDLVDINQPPERLRLALREAACQLLLRVQGPEAPRICCVALKTTLAEWQSRGVGGFAFREQAADEAMPAVPFDGMQPLDGLEDVDMGMAGYPPEDIDMMAMMSMQYVSGLPLASRSSRRDHVD